jgi:hypothetical protein
MRNRFGTRTTLAAAFIGARLSCRSGTKDQEVPATTSAPSAPDVSAVPASSRVDNQTRFTSYAEAVRIVRSIYDCDVEDVNRSTLVYGAEYCDAGGAHGYLIVNLRGREYIHAGVPRQVWEEFRDAESMGSYYASHLRGHYRLTLGY